MGMVRRVYAHRVHIDGIDRFAISAPEIGISESYQSENELETALEKLGFPDGFSHEVVRSLKNRGIVWLDLEGEKVPELLKRLNSSVQSH